MRFVWRLVGENRAREPLSGEGARLHGGRWNEPGVAVIYTSENRSLAALEVLVHLNGTNPRRRYRLLSYELDDELIETMSLADLPSDWRAEPPPASTVRLGTEWARAGRSVALKVPSAVLPEEYNVILNTAHADIAKVKPGRPVDFSFDPRLFRGES
jgi:RES domain-containing protein